MTRRRLKSCSWRASRAGSGEPGKQGGNQPRCVCSEGNPSPGTCPVIEEKGDSGSGAGVGVGGSGGGGGGPLSGRGRNLTAARPAQASPPASPPAAKAEHCELAHFAANFPLLRKTLSHPRERPHPALPGAVGSGSRGVTARGAADARVRAGAVRGPLYGDPNSGEGAGREGSPKGHWFANARELKGAGGGLWGGIIIRGQIAPQLRSAA